MSSPLIQWYPGHIAKAERALMEQLKKVDVVLEVRDARIPLATHHPQVPQWVGSKARILVLNRVDMIPETARQLWTGWFRSQGETPYFTDAQHGKGVDAVAQAAQVVGDQVNQRRHGRGMLPRPVRAVVIGFPNVGKSALINRLLNRRVVASARRAGITRQLRWVRISDQIELLDAPGVLPSRLNNQQAALRLAICDDIGEAAYDHQRVTWTLVDELNRLRRDHPALMTENPLETRYGLDAATMSGEEYLETLAKQRYQGDRERTAAQILNDFRKGILGPIVLEVPPISVSS
ncbi:ribosome biogenesis GTPase YlqF [Leptolyngbya sp. 'hensonii']|uniref:ribosome biogenesis GTPase YlqF n=1 Tax=Leptolyngbya sp. 'hensonii' TaxID=1922337 RepID=UPI00094FD2C4|nr:ribosome biogenesis GTPase YlqF [Leptolyngbya sp. 'hensonii']OLP19772.1 ribosome biogenesis GTPase YlqF [Leptolyngbya sp. 'hensonii']